MTVNRPQRPGLNSKGTGDSSMAVISVAEVKYTAKCEEASFCGPHPPLPLSVSSRKSKREMYFCDYVCVLTICFLQPKSSWFCLVCWHIPLILVLTRQRQVDFCEFEVSPNCIASSQPARGTQWNCVSEWWERDEVCVHGFFRFIISCWCVLFFLRASLCRMPRIALNYVAQAGHKLTVVFLTQLSSAVITDMCLSAWIFSF